MRKKNALKIQLLGEFRMVNKSFRFPQEKKKSMQLVLLIAYLITNQNKMCLKEDLMKLLWQEEESDNPEGALRNLVYRARKELQKFYPDKDVDFILSKGNTYAWNPDVACEIDIRHMEKLCAKMERLEDPDELYESCFTLLDKYSLQFMHEFHGQDWVEVQKLYYDDLFMRSISKTCDVLMKHKRYEDIIKLCDNVGYEYHANNRIHEYKLEAYCQSGQYILALSYYHKVIDMYYTRFSLEVSEECKQIYQRILDHVAHQSVNILELKHQLTETTGHQGAFFCDYDVFRNIYQMNLRFLKRSKEVRYLVLLTMEFTEEENREVQKEFDLLKNVIMKELRSNDVFTQCSSYKYAIILATSTEEGCQIAINRIEEQFNKLKKLESSFLQKEYETIELTEDEQSN